jgi:GNAT superfamily N-acetyltransferase
VMGSQDVDDVTLIRHAYVLPGAQGVGIGHSLLDHLLSATSRRVLVGTWTSAAWAIRFYERHGFTLTTSDETRRLLERYWSVAERQMEVSSVLIGPEQAPQDE